MEDLILNGKTLLVVDDEADLRDIVASELEFMGSRVLQAENIKSAEKLLLENKIDLVVSDIRMPGGTGVDLLNFIKHKNVMSPPIILITGFADITLEDALDKGAEALMNKPFKLDELIHAVARFTVPVEERFAQRDEIGAEEFNCNFSDTLMNKMLQKEFLVGRGGISFIGQCRDKKMSVGGRIKFKLNFDDVTLSGIAVCRSFQVLDQDNNEMMTSLEFVSLSKGTLKFFLKYWRENRIVSFIPALKH